MRPSSEMIGNLFNFEKSISIWIRNFWNIED